MITFDFTDDEDFGKIAENFTLDKLLGSFYNVTQNYCFESLTKFLNVDINSRFIFITLLYYTPQSYDDKHSLSKLLIRY